MGTQRRWFDRTFELGLGADAAPALLERLLRTPEHLATAVGGLPPEVLTRRDGGKWSIQENVGHLFDLESLWDQRLDDTNLTKARRLELLAALLERLGRCE